MCSFLQQARFWPKGCTKVCCIVVRHVSILIPLLFLLNGIYTGIGVPSGSAWVNSGSGDEPKCHRRDVNVGWRALRDASELTAWGTLIFSRIKLSMSDNVALCPSGKHANCVHHGDKRLLSRNFSEKNTLFFAKNFHP